MGGLNKCGVSLSENLFIFLTCDHSQAPEIPLLFVVVGYHFYRYGPDDPFWHGDVKMEMEWKRVKKAWKVFLVFVENATYRWKARENDRKWLLDILAFLGHFGKYETKIVQHVFLERDKDIIRKVLAE